MLKSHFNLNQNDEPEEEVPAEQGKEKPRKAKKKPLADTSQFAQSNVNVEEQEPEYEGLLEEHGGEAVHEEVLPVYPERRLNRSEVSVRLSFLGKTADGDGYTYLKAEITGLSLTDISAIKSFKHLQFLDVSNNTLTLSALQAITELPFLVLIQADKNILQSANLNRMKYLQVIIMNKNIIKSVEDIYQPELSTLELGNNKIRRIFFANRMPTMRCLDLRNNLIEEISEINFPNLDSLYLAGNKIKSIVGIERLVNLRILHLRNNPIRLLTGVDEALKKLQYVNLRNCRVATLIQVKKLRVLHALETLVMKNCPYMGGTGTEEDAGGAEEDDAEIRVEMLAALPRLKRINKTEVSPEERTEANDLMMTWLEEGEKDEEEVMEEMQEEMNTEEE